MSVVHAHYARPIGRGEAVHRRGGLLHPEAKQALGLWKKVCIVGSIAPDYPCLDVLHGTSTQWADAMHKGQAVTVIRTGIAAIRAMRRPTNDKNAWPGCSALPPMSLPTAPFIRWSTSRSAPMKKNKQTTAAARCHEDVYAHKRLNLGVLDFNRQISTNVHDSSDIDHPEQMDPDIAALWREALTATYPQLGNPDVHAWHNAMRKMMKIGESGNVLFPFARHVATNLGLIYPAAPEPTYIDTLKVPGDQFMPFEEIFQKALVNVIEMWGWMALSLQNQPSPLDTLKSMSLDTGLDTDGRMVYWS